MPPGGNAFMDQSKWGGANVACALVNPNAFLCVVWVGNDFEKMGTDQEVVLISMALGS